MENKIYSFNEAVLIIFVMKVHEVINKSRALRYLLQVMHYLLLSALLICAGLSLFDKAAPVNIQFLVIVLFLGIEFLRASPKDFAVMKDDYLKWRSKDSWLRIIGVTVFIFAAAVLVSAVIISFIIKK